MEVDAVRYVVSSDLVRIGVPQIDSVAVASSNRVVQYRVAIGIPKGYPVIVYAIRDVVARDVVPCGGLEVDAVVAVPSERVAEYLVVMGIPDAYALVQLAVHDRVVHDTVGSTQTRDSDPILVVIVELVARDSVVRALVEPESRVNVHAGVVAGYVVRTRLPYDDATISVEVERIVPDQVLKTSCDEEGISVSVEGALEIEERRVGKECRL